MMVSTKYDMHQYVGIAGMKGKKGRIVNVTFNGNNMTYGIEYWDGGDFKIAHLWEDEITEEYSEVE